jgi:hypothetical protein
MNRPGVSSGSVRRRALARHFSLTRQAGAWRSQGGEFRRSKPKSGALGFQAFGNLGDRFPCPQQFGGFATLSFLQGLLVVLRDSGHAGLFLVLDEIERLS